MSDYYSAIKKRITLLSLLKWSLVASVVVLTALYVQLEGLTVSHQFDHVAIFIVSAVIMIVMTHLLIQRLKSLLDKTF